MLAPLVALLTSVGTFVALHRLSRLSQQPAGDGAAGVSRRRLLVGSAAVVAGADQVFTTSVDGWTCGSRPDDRPRALRVRLRNKWITDMELTTFDARRAYWPQRGWGQRAPIKTMSRIDSPGPFGRVSPDTPITGIAWAQTRGIEKVEVRLDHGDWRLAELSTEVNLDTWRMFRLRGRWEPGHHLAEARATDTTGYTQTADRTSPSRTAPVGGIRYSSPSSD